ncbi:MAG: hypothetical protein R3F49_08575 [Planctomycetota bacterium]
MHPKRLSLALLALCLTGSGLAQNRLVGVDTSGASFYDIDIVTGARTLVGAITGAPGVVGALAYDDTNGVMYLSSTSLDALYILDVNTLDATLVGPYNVGATVVMHGLEYVEATGKLYGHSSSLANGADLFEIDTATGQATGIGASGTLGFGSLAYVNGTMYLSDTVGDQLMSIDLVTAAATAVGPFGVAGSVGIGFAYDPALGLYASDNVTDSLYTVDVTTGAATVIGAFGASNMISLEFIGAGSGTFGTPYCTANANSTGATGAISGSGSLTAADNDVTLMAGDLPLNAFGFFLVAPNQGFNANPGGSQGNLCLSGNIGRYVGPGQVLNSGALGEFALILDLTQTPTPNGFISVMAGDTANFQAWYRDSVMGSATSNFTNGLEVTFN